jgi:transcriptional antiterminator RfaH
MTITTADKWYVAHTHAHAEVKAIEHLRRQGFVTYLPRYRKERRHARRTETVAAPLFPRYCFVAFNMATQRWPAIRSTFGIDHLVGGDAGPASVADEVIERLREREDETGFIQLNPSPRFAPGDKVRLISGAFSVCAALFDGMTDRDRVDVLLEFLGRKVRMTIDSSAIERF